MTERVAVRFGLLYLTLFILATQISGSMLPNPIADFNGLGRLWPMRAITGSVARHAFGITSDLDADSNGEPLFFWVQTAWIVIAALAGAAVWTAFDRARPLQGRLTRGFRRFVRLALAAALIEYGMTKVIPTQFPAPSLETLVTPVGDLSLSALLWTSIGASPAYQMFTGWVEVLGGVLLLVPRTAILGAIVSLAAAFQVFVLNMTFDIGLKFVSLHLIVLALVLLAPDLPRLARILVGWGTALDPHAPVARNGTSTRIAMAQLAFAAYLLAMYAYINVGFWNVAGGGAPKSPLYGIWNIETMTVDGVTAPSHLNDYDRRWRRLIFDAPGSATFQRTDDSFARYSASLDMTSRTLTLTRRGSRNWSAAFTFDQPTADRMLVEGTMDGRHIEMRLRQQPFDTFRLLNSPFRWVRPHDP